MTREQYIKRSMKLRKGNTTAVVLLSEGRRYTHSTTKYVSNNLAKKANGCNAVALQRGENFPPKLSELSS